MAKYSYSEISSDGCCNHCSRSCNDPCHPCIQSFRSCFKSCMEFTCDRKCAFLWSFIATIFVIMALSGIIAAATGTKTLNGNAGAAYFLITIVGSIVSIALAIWSCNRHEGGWRGCCFNGCCDGGYDTIADSPV